MDSLLTAKARLEANGIDVLGPIDHTLFKSIYFFQSQRPAPGTGCQYGELEKGRGCRPRYAGRLEH